MTHDNYPMLIELPIEALPEELSNDAQEALLSALDSNRVTAKEIKIAYAQEDLVYPFGGKPPVSYSWFKPADEILIQLTARIPLRAKYGDQTMSQLAALERKIVKYNADIEPKLLEAEIAQDEIALRKKREQLAALRSQ